MDTPNSTPLAPLAGHPNQGAPSLRLWLNANGGKLGLGLTALVALNLMPFASLTIQAFAMIVAFMALIMTKRMSVLTALIIVPIVFALLGGFAPEIGPMMLDGVKAIAPTAAMLMFAILFFGIMIDVGLFDPVVKLVVRAVHGDPLRIVVGTAVLALVVSLDGDGSTTYLITTAAMLPLYTRLGVNRLMLACVIMMAGGVMNILPWGGPPARAAAALKVDAAELFVPMLPAIAVGAAWVIFVAWIVRTANDAVLRHDLAHIVYDALRRQREATLGGPVGQTREYLLAQRQERGGVLQLALGEKRQAWPNITHDFCVREKDLLHRRRFVADMDHLGILPAARDSQKLLDSKKLRRGVCQIEGHEAPSMAASITHRAEQTGRPNEGINEDAVAPAHAGRKGETLQRLPSGELGKVDFEIEIDLLNEGAAVLQPTRDDAGKHAGPMSGKIDAPVLKCRPCAKPVARGFFPLPPFFQ